MRTARVLVAALVAPVIVHSRARAQESVIPIRCDGQIISDVAITTRPAYDEVGSRWWEFPIRWANALHVTTEPSVVRRFLLVKPGTPCLERQRAESERILRVQPFLAEARIDVVADSLGGVVLKVETRDELTPVIAAKTGQGRITGLKLGDRNFLGSGSLLTGEWRNGELRDEYSAEFVDYQFLGRPYVFTALGGRRDAGAREWATDMSHPFFTDQQRFAWSASAGSRLELFGFSREIGEPVPIGFEKTFFDLGGVIRIGQPGRLSLFGVSFSHETDTPSLPVEPEPGVAYDSLLARYPARRNARVNALWGLRNIEFVLVDRLDGLNATQDIRRGFQVGMLLGRSLSVLGTTDDDFLLAVDGYIGAGSARTFAWIAARGEGRQNYDENNWDGILGSGRFRFYRRLFDANTMTATVDWSGGWRQRVPFQLLLGLPNDGVRGYRKSRDAGAQRAVARIEDRWYLGALRRRAGVGLAFFADAGRVWAGGAPYGVDTPLKFGAGFGLLASVPPRSKRTWRMDVMFPLSADAKAKWEIRLTSFNAGRSWKEPGDVSRSRERSVPISVFNWP